MSQSLIRHSPLYIMLKNTPISGLSKNLGSVDNSWGINLNVNEWEGLERFHKFFFAVKVILFAMSILSLYFLTSSSPNKGDAFGREVFVCINPLALLALPLYFATQNTGGEGEMYIPFSLPVSRSITENCVSHIGKYTRTIPVNYRLSQNLVEIVF